MLTITVSLVTRPFDVLVTQRMAYMVLAVRLMIEMEYSSLPMAISVPFVLKAAGSKLDTSVKLPLTGGTATICGW